ncbi:MAG TPA: M67 family metallopeptidase [Actinomycetota bacterium]|nr:M67 family metallopeptidase [Actinomycetota bacterium]
MTELDGVLFKEIVEHGLREFPNEACGLLAGRDGQAVRFYPMRNADASPVTYRLDPREQLRVFDELEREGLELFGIVHSHTHSEPYPSETDRRQAFYPEPLYLILGLADRERPVLRAFRIVEGEVTEEELRIV